MKHAGGKLWIAAVLIGACMAAYGEGAGPIRRKPTLQPPPAAASAATPTYLPYTVPATGLPPNCPKTLATWVRWRDRAIAQLLAPRNRSEDKIGPLLDADQVIAQSTAIANVFDDCMDPDKFEKDRHPQLGNLWRFAQTMRNQADVYHQFGHGVRDSVYLERVTADVELPTLLKSPDFLRKISNRSTYAAALELIDTQNKALPPEEQWTVLIYRSAVLGTPDPSDIFGRFFILVPGKERDQWIQFGIRTPDDDQSETPINNVSVVSIAKKPANRPGFVALVDWWRIYRESGEIDLMTRKQATGVTGNCLQCHKTGPIGIRPEMVYVFSGKDLVRADRPWLVPDQINQRFKGYDWPDFRTVPAAGDPDDELASPDNYGPALGPDRDRSDAYMRACTSRLKLKPGALQRIRDKMDCVKCHAADDRGSLNFPMATQAPTAYRLTDETWPNLIHTYVMEGFMPKGEPPLELNERQGLYNCLMREYYDPIRKKGLLVDWLKEGRKDVTTNVGVRARAVAPASMAAKMAAPAGGSSAFERGKCTKCHSVPPGDDDAGPNLRKVFGRVMGTLPDYGYSKSLSEAGAQKLEWSEQNLLQFLLDPSAFLTQQLHHPARSKMKVSVPDAALRQQIVDYLKSLN
jgi:cytochrome c